MKGSDNHIIHKLNLEVDASTNAVAHDFRDNISIYLKNELFPYLEELFQSYESKLGNDIIQVDQLHIDLSHSGTHSFESLKSALKEQLKEQLVAVITHPEKYPDTVVKIDKNEHDVQTLIHFLETGLAPWWTTTNSEAIFSVAHLKEYTSSSSYTSLMQTAIQRSYVQQRLLHQFNDDQIQLMLLPIGKLKEVRAIIEVPLVLLTKSETVRRLYWNWVMQLLHQRKNNIAAAVNWLYAKLNNLIVNDQELKAWAHWLNSLNESAGEPIINEQLSTIKTTQQQGEFERLTRTDIVFEDTDLSGNTTKSDKNSKKGQSAQDEVNASVETNEVVGSIAKPVIDSIVENKEEEEKGESTLESIHKNSIQREKNHSNESANKQRSFKEKDKNQESTTSLQTEEIVSEAELDELGSTITQQSTDKDVTEAISNENKIEATSSVVDQSKVDENEGTTSAASHKIIGEEAAGLKSSHSTSTQKNEKDEQEANTSEQKQQLEVGDANTVHTPPSNVATHKEGELPDEVGDDELINTKGIAGKQDSVGAEHLRSAEVTSDKEYMQTMSDDAAIAAKFDAFYNQLSKPVNYPKSTQKVYYLENAGLVLLHPYLRSFFEQCGVYKEEAFTDVEQAIHLLHYLATGQEQQHESNLVFEKFLCNFPLEESIPRSLKITEEQKAQATELLEAVLEHWGVLKGASIELLRGEFLQRQGKLVLKGKQPRIVIERKTHDILLDKLPWNIGLFKLPWRDTITFADW